MPFPPTSIKNLFEVLNGTSCVDPMLLRAAHPLYISVTDHNLFLFFSVQVKAWIAEKDAEALRCQKLLVEEEEAAQRR